MSGHLAECDGVGLLTNAEYDVSAGTSFHDGSMKRRRWGCNLQVKSLKMKDNHAWARRWRASERPWMQCHGVEYHQLLCYAINSHVTFDIKGNRI